MEYSPSNHSMYSRATIHGDQEILPHALGGLRRTAFLMAYIAIVSISICGVLYCLYVSPLIAIFGLVMSYWLNNIAFTITHVRFHTSFIEVPEPKMDVLIHHSFIHHYRDIQIYHKTWLESRMSYFIDPRDGLLSPVFMSQIPVTLGISWLLYRQHHILGIIYFSSVWASELLQSTVHEWYHNPAKNRKSFYNPVAFWFLTMLEKVGLASTKTHLQHHRHRLHNLHEVEQWLDLAIPFGERLPIALWKKALTKYVPGEINMTPYLMKIIYVSYCAIHVFMVLAYLAVYPILH